MIKRLKIKINELTGSKYRKLRKFYEKGNEEIDIENITSDPQTKLARLWVNLPSEWGDCWMPLDGALYQPASKIWNFSPEYFRFMAR